MEKGKRPRKRKAPEAETLPLPPREPPPNYPERVPEHVRPGLFRLLQRVRATVGAMLDVADAAAEAIAKQFRGERR